MTEPTTLGNDLLRSAARLSRWASRHASFDVPFAQARLLALLDELGPSRVSALAAADHSSQPTITTQLQRLEAAGWVHRASDPDDARATVISLSVEGHAALESVRRARLAVLSPALDQLDGPALERVQVAIDVMNELLAAAADAPTPHSTPRGRMTTTMWRQPKTVWSIAFACVISFMGIGLVDPILKPIADELGAGPSEVSLLFTSYLAVMGIAMLGTGWVSSRVGAKRTLLLGLALIIIGAAFAGSQDTVGGIVAFRALWGLGNALFIATALATIVNAAAGSVKQAIILYEAALGVGIATGPLLGGWLGGISWRWPFYGVAVLMAIAFIATATTLPKTPRAENPTSITAPLRALTHRGLLTVGITALLYNFGFFTLLAFTPFPLAMGAHEIGLIFFGWGVLLAITSVFVAPVIQRRFGTLAGIVGALLGFAVILAAMAIWTEDKRVLVVGVILAGAFLGVNNTLITETVMKVSPVERGVASAAYSFVRFSGGAVAPWLAGTLGEKSIHLPFWVGSAAVVLGVLVLLTARHTISALDEAPGHGAEPVASRVEAEALTVGDA